MFVFAWNIFEGSKRKQNCYLQKESGDLGNIWETFILPHVFSLPYQIHIIHKIITKGISVTQVGVPEFW